MNLIVQKSTIQAKKVFDYLINAIKKPVFLAFYGFLNIYRIKLFPTRRILRI